HRAARGAQSRLSTATISVPVAHPTIDHRERLWTGAVKSRPFASGLAAAYFIYPPKFSLYIADPQHVAELGFTLLLAVTASKAVGVLTDDKPPKVASDER